jgi:hypothetical protein
MSAQIPTLETPTFQSTMFQQAMSAQIPTLETPMFQQATTAQIPTLQMPKLEMQNLQASAAVNEEPTG